MKSLTGKQKIILLCVAIVIVLLGIFVYYIFSGNDNFPLGLGSRGKRVKNVQTQINFWLVTMRGFGDQYKIDLLDVNGIWDINTNNAVKLWYNSSLGTELRPMTESDYNSLLNLEL